MSKDDLEQAHNDGQRDGADNNFEGTLFSGRSYEEHEAYKEGFAHGKGTADKGKDFDLGYIGDKHYIAGRSS
ncbi:MAG: hypothetical protein JXR14_02400 [Paracoccaceae bacterium]